MNIRIALSIISIAGLLSADTLTLKNGSTIKGHFVGGDDNTIRFAVGNQVNTYDVVDIDSLHFAPPPSTAVNYQAPPPAPLLSNPAPPPPLYSSSANSTTPVPAPSGPPSDSTAPYSPPPPPPAAVPANNVEIPAGAQIVVRMIDPADSKNDSLGKTYRASVEQPVSMNGQIIIPRGSDAVAVLSNQQQSGKIEGKTILTLSLRSVSVNGHTYDLASSNVSKASGSRTTKSGEVIGGGAAFGAIIGALAGGGKGAAIGALSGGALGTAAQVATSGERVKVPSETVLTFTLQNPLYVSPN
jgi:hypothetical protein